MFDVLTYQKGGALLRMLEQYLGADRFREGVNHYLRVHQHGNTETNDLWDAIEETSGEPVRQMMDSWIWQPGYPLISASIDGGDAGAAPAALHVRPCWPRRRHRDDLAGAGARAGGRRGADRPGRGARGAGRADRPGGCGRGERRRSRVLPGGVQRRAAGSRLRRGPRFARQVGALQPRRRRVERGRRRPAPGRRLPGVRRGVRRRAGARGLAGDRARPPWPRPAARRRRLPVVPSSRPHPAGARRRRARRSRRRRGRPPGQTPRPARRSPRDPGRRRGHQGPRGRAARPSGGRPRPCAPGAGGRRHLDRRRRRRRGGVRADARRLPLGGDAAGSAALPVLTRRVRLRGAHRGGRASWPSATR